MSVEPTNNNNQQQQIRIALGITYDGSAYHGWQKQVDLASVQSQLEQALARIAGHAVHVICAGRTDAGVHATGQVVHFDTFKIRSEQVWVAATNSYLAPDIRVTWARTMPGDFHARFSAVARRYQYIIYNHAISPVLQRQKVSWVVRHLTLEVMQEAAQYLIGEHDFSSFRARECQAKSPIRIIQQLDITQQSHYLVLEIKANAFLHHMVRNIAGVLIDIGKGKQPPIWAEQVLAARDRMAAGVTASPHGLYLVEVKYPERYCLPKLLQPAFFISC